MDHLLADLLVHTGYSNEDIRLHFLQSLRQIREVRAVRQRYAAVEQREIHVPGRDMRKRQK
jgi:hypothetical protein